MDTFVSLQVFRQVVEAGSFVGAAEQMQLSPAMVSKHVMHLERQLGARLLIRTSRRVSLTDNGKLYFEKCRVALDGLDEAKFMLQDPVRAPKGVLRVCVPSWFSEQGLTKVLALYQQRYPHVVLDVKLNRHIDGLIDDETDVGIRIVDFPVENLPAQIQAVRLRAVQFLLVAAPSYLENHPAITSPADLHGHRYIAFPKTRDTLEEQLVFKSQMGTQVGKVQIGFYANNMNLICQAAISGIGLALIPEEVALPHVEAGRLQQIMPNHQSARHEIYALCARHRRLEPKIYSFTSFISEFYSEQDTRIVAWHASGLPGIESARETRL